MKSEMNPDDFFIIFSKKINEFFRISDHSIFFTKLSHTLRSDLSIRMEKFIDEVDENKGARHRSLLDYFSFYIFTIWVLHTYLRTISLFRKMFHDKYISHAIIVRTGMGNHIECPLLDPRGRAVLTKCHIVTSSWLMKPESFDEVVFVCYFRNLKRRVLRCGSEYSRIPEVLCVTIRDECIVSCHTNSYQITNVLGEIGTSFYLFMEWGDLFESEHSFID